MDEGASPQHEIACIPTDPEQALDGNSQMLPPRSPEVSEAALAPVTERTPTPLHSGHGEDGRIEAAVSITNPLTESCDGSSGHTIHVPPSPTTSYSHRVYIKKRDEALAYARKLTGIEGRILLWTDASCMGVSGSGAFVRQDTGDSWKVHTFVVGGLKGINEFENLAISKAMDSALADARGKPLGSFAAVSIMTDSQASLGELQRVYRKEKRVSKQKFVANILAVAQKLAMLRVAVEFHWVPSHAAIPGNAIADSWATKAYKKAGGVATGSTPLIFDLPVIKYCGSWERLINPPKSLWMVDSVLESLPGPAKKATAAKKASPKMATSTEVNTPARGRRRQARPQRQKSITDAAVAPPQWATAETQPDRPAMQVATSATSMTDKGMQTLSKDTLRALKRTPWAFEVMGRLHPEMVRHGCFPTAGLGQVGLSPRLKARMTFYIATS